MSSSPPARVLMDVATRTLAHRPRASMAEIAEQAKVELSHLTRYFATRQELLRAICLEAFDRMDAACAGVHEAPTMAEKLRLILTGMVPLGAAYHFLYGEAVGIRNVEVNLRVARQLEQTQAMIDWAKAQGEIDPQLPTSWLVRLLDGTIWAAWHSLAHDGLSVERLVQLSFDSLWPAMRAPKDD